MAEYGDLNYTTAQVNEAISKALEGGGGGSATIPVVVVEGTSVTQELQPNTYYEFGEVTDLNITLSDEIPDIYNEYMFEFTSGATAATLTLPNDIKWIGDESPIIEANQIYQVSILNHIGAIAKVTNASGEQVPIEYSGSQSFGNETTFKIDGIDFLRKTTAIYNIGSLVTYNSGSYDYLMDVQLEYSDGSTSDSNFSAFNDVSKTIEKTLSKIQVIYIDQGEGGGN